MVDQLDRSLIWVGIALALLALLFFAGALMV
jgi:hypothetical protein